MTINDLRRVYSNHHIHTSQKKTEFKAIIRNTTVYTFVQEKGCSGKNQTDTFILILFTLNSLQSCCVFIATCDIDYF